jgi:hypothetical protein
MRKVLQLLDRFKSVGDVIANVDPVHVGLPWAGIRVILEVSIRLRNVPSWSSTNAYWQGRVIR